MVIFRADDWEERLTTSNVEVAPQCCGTIRLTSRQKGFVGNACQHTFPAIPLRPPRK